MIVCVCKSVSDRKIRASIAEGMDSFDDLQFELGVATCCGKCEETVREVMAQSGACGSGCCGGAQKRLASAAPATTLVPVYEPQAA
ncbi:MAG: (2Fe-2S)-binding protein [Paraburkholderia sp.]|uniref:(2Fe-2S)-binding protein n=1 Tax=Paraburkholderia sp. TaxID=1926495 RepID=UPI0012030C5E|nr:(2Fe-2S)-binding protein [Paraburkholderia sp.]TAM04562.1 MAG: (2Fe-2S)-binding protein [Paraburkholderia sp.]TAM27827.1 MAG: (2Fe-2S)-binding protein [Paraburkholderia sp.]